MPTLGDDIDMFLDPILSLFRTTFLTQLVGEHVAIYLAGSAQVTSWGKTLKGIPITFEGPPMKQAITYAQKHCAQLVTQMNDESKRLIAQVISDGIKNKRGVDGLARDIRSQFSDMVKSRSQVIARTESADALQQAFMDRAEDMGINGKEWIVTDPCPICEENGNAGVIGINEAFPSGDYRPPAHPNCRCALAPVMIKD